MSTDQDIAGDNNVIIGRRKVRGSGNVIIDSTDAYGNVILNRPMIIGAGAKGGPNDIVIGAGAGAGSDLFFLLDQLKFVDSNTTNYIRALISELKSPNRDVHKINKIWQSVKAVVTVGSAVDLVTKIGLAIATIT